jgi:uncharacterized RDD family membrane protein YckC
MMKQKIPRHTGRRALAATIDYGILTGCSVLILSAVGTTDADGIVRVTGIPALMLMAAGAVIWLLYFPLAEALFGQTLAKAALRLEVVRLDGKPLRFGDAVQRRIIDLMELWMFGIPALISATQSPYGQRFGDRLAATTVVADEDARCPGCGTLNVIRGREVITRSFQCGACSRTIDLLAPWRSQL